MKFADVIEAKGEAERFLDRLDKYRKAWEESLTDTYKMPERAAMLRASLDLTKTLARMRRGNE